MQDYIFSNEYFQNVDATVYTCGYESCEPGHSYGPVVRSGYLIHYVESGTGIYKVGDQVYRLKAGDAFLIVPGTLIYYEADKKDPWVYTWIGFEGVKVKEYLSRTTLLDEPVFRYGDDERFRLCHERMYSANQLNENKDLLMNSILYEYLFLLAGKFPKLDVSIQERKESYIQEALKYLETSYDTEISVGGIADHLNIDRSYLHRLFKAKMGISLQKYLTNFRMKKACSMLVNTDYTIATIARSVGYQDSLYFSRLFRQQKKSSPSEYRKTRTQSKTESDLPVEKSSIDKE